MPRFSRRAPRGEFPKAAWPRLFLQTMSWMHRARIARQGLAAATRSKPAAPARRLALPVALAVGAGLSASAAPLLLETPETKKYDFQERAKPRASPVIKRRVVVEEVEEPEEEAAPADEPAAATEPAAEPAVEPAAEPEEHESAFDERTGEINWDCPCLGGMAHGPCGEEFKKAFSCFIFSEQEPKGIDCVDLFKDMQDCFRKHPEVYAEEIEADNAAEADVAATTAVAAEEAK